MSVIQEAKEMREEIAKLRGALVEVLKYVPWREAERLNLKALATDVSRGRGLGETPRENIPSRVRDF